ncbi:amino acid ABC transporter substrate-binding protein [Pseudomonas fulva]|uniref:Amino acid ABC transporter substrate-binding protein n=1 Tax=Pseudomonas putida TaxID=303 RepID=A0A7W2KYL7_PSEPU|nr:MULTISPECIES: transporter substrate-binding domain-containing protein [Pseudomonas]MBA1221455.1 amino acid ABC transporter substrate-binding protein [Pseudomonas fulva]MBA6115087.1 amino acid ABC transporter substrate-binding protein [Pseudomonas putida]MCZ9637240.1 ABC transporter substrate-binding protein [Pseudomonas putida]MEC4875253.1 ABC transporter substrate-binding protein [Pseudomonas sp. NC26]
MSRAAALTLPLILAATAHAADGTLQPEHLSIGSDLTYPPYTYLAQGKPAGFDPEFMTLLGQQLKLTPQFHDTRFANLVMGVNARRFDVVASALYVTPERAAQVDFVPYLKSGASLMVRTDDNFRPQSPEDLCGKRVGSIKGGSWIPKLMVLSKSYCQANGQAPIDSREFPTSPEAAQALLANAVDVQFEDAAVAAITADKLKGRVTLSSQTLIYPVVIGLAVRKGNDALLKQIDQGLAAMKASGDYQTLLNRYNLGEPTPTDVAQALGKAPQAVSQ